MSNVRPMRTRKPVSLIDAVDTSVDAMTWLKPTDHATAELARQYARVVESAEEGNFNALARGMLTTLKALGGTPAERKALGIEEVVSGSLANLRDRRTRQRDSEDSDTATD